MSKKPTSIKLGKIELQVNQKTDKFSKVPTVGNYLKGSVDVEMLEDIAECVNHKIPIILEGPTGCGKTAIVKWLAAVTNNSYERVQMTGSTDIDNFVGRVVLQPDPVTKETVTAWEDGILTRAMKHGYWLLLDEFNMALPEIITIMNSVLDDDGSLRLDSKDGTTVVEAHPNFRVFATMNPPDDYAGTKDLNIATKNRFAIFEFQYPSPVHEVEIISKHTGILPEFGMSVKKSKDSFLKRMVRFANIIRQSNVDQQTNAVCSTRQLIQWAQLVKALGIKRAARIAVVNKANEEDRLHITDHLDKEFSSSETFEAFEIDFKNEKKAIEAYVKKDKQSRDLQDTFDEANAAFRELSSEFDEVIPGASEIEDYELADKSI